MRGSVRLHARLIILQTGFNSQLRNIVFMETILRHNNFSESRKKLVILRCVYLAAKKYQSTGEELDRLRLLRLGDIAQGMGVKETAINHAFARENDLKPLQKQLKPLPVVGIR